MRTRKIEFQVGIADDFYYPKKDGVTNLHLWPHAIGEFELLLIPIEFDWDEKEDIMRPAERALDEYMKSVFPKKEYKIYYWWWKDNETTI